MNKYIDELNIAFEKTNNEFTGNFKINDNNYSSNDLDYHFPLTVVEYLRKEVMSKQEWKKLSETEYQKLLESATKLLKK